MESPLEKAPDQPVSAARDKVVVVWKRIAWVCVGRMNGVGEWEDGRGDLAVGHLDDECGCHVDSDVL